VTALKPVVGGEVTGVLSKTYLPNLICAHPFCDKPVESIHHIFGRPPGQESDSWFVRLQFIDEDGTAHVETPLPHATGLCGSGTTGHHGDVEEHRAWIRYQNGQYVWYERNQNDPANTPLMDQFDYVGPLNPQPGAREATPKPPMPKDGEKKKRKKQIFSVSLPENEDMLHVEVPRKFEQLRTILEDPARPRSKGYTLATVLDLALLQARDDV